MRTLKLYFLTNNKHKYSEILDIFNKVKTQIRIEMYSYPNTKLEIQAENLEEIVKFAVKYARKKGLDNFFIEDSGLFIEALKGFPGPFSSYVFKTIGIPGILRLLENETNRKAFFKSVIGLCLNGKTYIFTGVVKGRISEIPRGKHGFGFDPIFIPNGFSKTFAEMTLKEKNTVSHRSRAAKKMLNFLQNFLRGDVMEENKNTF